MALNLKPGKFTLTNEHLERALIDCEHGTRPSRCLVAQGLAEYFGTEQLWCGYDEGQVEGHQFNMIGADSLVSLFDAVVISTIPTMKETLVDRLKYKLPAEVEITFVSSEPVRKQY